MKLLRALSLVVLLAGTAPAVAADGELEIRQLEEHIFLHTSYQEIPGYGWFPSNGLILVKDGRAVLVDTAWTEQATREIMAWLQQKKLTLDFVLVTHWHDDRTAGLEYLNGLGIRTWASAGTNARLAENDETPASMSFPASGILDADWPLEVFYPGAGHTSDNHVVWLPEQRILFGGCFVKSAASKSLGNVADADLSAWSGSIQRVLQEFTGISKVVPGHGEPGSVELLHHTQALLEKRNSAPANAKE